MELTLEQLLRGKATRIKNKSYFTTEQYVEPFLNKMSKYTDDFLINVKLPDQITISPEKEINCEDITFNRVWIQAVLPESYSVDKHDSVIGFLYGIDVRKPLVKIYRGGLNQACTNLCVFNPDELLIQDLQSETAMDYRPVDKLMEKPNDLKEWINLLRNTSWKREDEFIERNLGQWIRRIVSDSYDLGYGKVKLSAELAVSAYKLLFEDFESPYYIKPKEDVDLFRVYNAFTELITHDKDKDLINKVEKTLLLKNILNI